MNNMNNKLKDYKQEHDILAKAEKIVFERTGQQATTYGPFTECHERAAKIASVLCNKDITCSDVFNVMIALKLARESYTHKEDNLLDAVAYIAGLNNMHNGFVVEEN